MALMVLMTSSQPYQMMRRYSKEIVVSPVVAFFSFVSIEKQDNQSMKEIFSMNYRVIFGVYYCVHLHLLNIYSIAFYLASIYYYLLHRKLLNIYSIEVDERNICQANSNLADASSYCFIGEDLIKLWTLLAIPHLEHKGNLNEILHEL